MNKVFEKFGSGLTCTVKNGEKTKSIHIIGPKELEKGTMKDIKSLNPTFDLEKT